MVPSNRAGMRVPFKIRTGIWDETAAERVSVTRTSERADQKHLGTSGQRRNAGSEGDGEAKSLREGAGGDDPGGPQRAAFDGVAAVTSRECVESAFAIACGRGNKSASIGPCSGNDGNGNPQGQRFGTRLCGPGGSRPAAKPGGSPLRAGVGIRRTTPGDTVDAHPRHVNRAFVTSEMGSTQGLDL